MPTLKTADLRAINWYAGKNNLKLCLSLPPAIYFTHNSGKEIRVSIINIRAAYERSKKEEKKNAKARND